MHVVKIYTIGTLLLAGFLAACLFPFSVQAGAYLDSAHGNSTYGVNRSAYDLRYADFATGNCAHCHETHASIAGSDPGPAGGPSAHTLFATNFNSTRTQQPYLESDNFCFACHSELVGQQVVNQDYSTTFGGGTNGTGPQSIMTAFNLNSYHNLYDIWSLLQNNPFFPGFNINSNPCGACHNSHLAKRNWDSAQPGFPLLSSISKPNATGSLWGETELMSSYLGYEAPYTFATNREPAGVGDADGTQTPDYVGFCSSCHDQNNLISSTSLSRPLKMINWENTGLGANKHGNITREGNNSFREPYVTAAAIKSNFVLSCMDCHEPHGAANIMLLRSRANGENLEATIAAADATMGYLCKRCHTDDLTAAAGTNAANSWEYVHHLATGAPYAKTACGTCHGVAGGIGGGAGGEPIDCGHCHGHGMDDSVLGVNATGRITF